MFFTDLLNALFAGLIPLIVQIILAIIFPSATV